MVNGLDKFREYFKDYTGSYVIIGGAACDIALGVSGWTPRRTKDIDIILIVEALTASFVKHFWKFIKDAGYTKREESEEDRKYYRFMKPTNPDFPYQIELFSRKPDILNLDGTPHLTPIPTDDDLSSLSAILLNDAYYHFTIEHSSIEDGLNNAKTEALICLKAKAFLDLKTRKDKGDKVEEKNIKKHKNDIFRLALLLSPESIFDLPEEMKSDMQKFIDTIAQDLPTVAIFKEMGAGNVDIKGLFRLVANNFKLTIIDSPQ